MAQNPSAAGRENSGTGHILFRWKPEKIMSQMKPEAF
jgi:hypothetical protein